MVRISKVGEIRHVSRKRPTRPGVKTGRLKEKNSTGYKHHENALSPDVAKGAFIPKIK